MRANRAVADSKKIKKKPFEPSGLRVLKGETKRRRPKITAKMFEDALREIRLSPYQILMEKTGTKSVQEAIRKTGMKEADVRGLIRQQGLHVRSNSLLGSKNAGLPVETFIRNFENDQLSTLIGKKPPKKRL